MKIHCTTPTTQVRQTMDEYSRRCLKAAMRDMAYLGEQCVTEARKNHTYKDQTGNLTSSVGYVLSNNGQVVSRSAFEAVTVTRKVKRKGKTITITSTGTDGAQDGKQYAEQMARMLPGKTAIVVVAGMMYGRYVAARGYNVLDSAIALARRKTSK